MKHLTFLMLLLTLSITLTTKTFAQNIAINETGSLPDTSAMLDISSTTKGFLAPRMTTAQRDLIPLPAIGLMIFNTSTNAFNVNTGTVFSPIWSAVAAGATTHTLGSSTNTLTSTVNGISATAPLVNSVSNTSSVNSLTTTINGVAGSSVNIINSNATSLSGSNLTTTVNGVAASALDLSPAITAKSWGLTGNPGIVSGTNFLGSTNNASVRFKTNNTEKAVLDSNGRFGIGVTNPSTLLAVGGTANVTGATTLGSTLAVSGATTLSGTVTATALGSGAATDSIVTVNAAGVLRERRVVDILAGGTNTLGSSVNTLTSTVNGVAATAPLVNSVSNTSSVNSLTTTINGVAGSSVNIINSNATSLSGSNLTTTVNGIAASALDLSPAITAKSWGLTGNSGIVSGTNFLGSTNNASVRFKTNNTEKAVLDSNGRFGIGVTNPSTLLAVGGTANVTGATTLGSTLAVSGATTLSGTVTATALGSGAATDSLVTVNTTTGLLNKRRVADVINGSGWSLNGNSGTTPGTNFIGTSDGQDVVMKAGGTERLRIINSSGDIKIGNTDSGMIRSTKEFIMREEGDEYGPSTLRLRNRNGENGAIFETIGATAYLVDYIFRTGATAASQITSNIRFEARAGNTSMKMPGSVSEWQFGQPDEVNGGPTLVVGAWGTGSNSCFRLGKVGIGVLTPTAKLDVSGTFKVSDSSYLSGVITASSLGTGASTDDIVTINGSNVVKRVTMSSFATTLSPWYVSTTSNGATTAAQAMYHTGNINIGGSSASVTPSYLISLDGASARTIGMERITTAADGNDLSIQAGGGNASNNKAGGDLYLKSGISTGTGSSNLYLQTATAGTTGSTDRTPTTKMTILGNGNVGIGTAAPTTTLAVTGTLSATGATTLNNTLDVNGATSLNSTLEVTGNTTLSGTLTASSFGTGTLTDDVVTISGTNVVRRISMSSLGGSAGPWFQATTSTAATTAAQAMYHTGNINIGGSSASVTPSYLISLDGASARTIGMERITTAADGNDLSIQAGAGNSSNNRAGGDLYLKSGISTGTGTSNLYFQTTTAGTTGAVDRTPTTKMTILGSGNVGIGTATPTTTLAVAGTLSATGVTTLSSTLSVASTTTLSSTLSVASATTLSSTLDVTGDAEFSGKVGIGTAPSTKLHVSGGLVLDDLNAANITGDNQTVTVGDASYLRLTSNNGTANNRTITLSNGLATGQILFIENASAANQFEVADNAGTNNTNTGAARAMGPGDVIQLIWNGTDWLEVSFANN